jgi:hypothetical protein
MRMTNWTQLARILVDGPDLDETYIAQSIAENMLVIAGEGVLPTVAVPNPCQIVLNASNFTGGVSPGFAVDPTGQLIDIPVTGSAASGFVIQASDPTNPRWDLVVAEFVQTGDTLIPQPSNPANSVYMFLHEDFLVKVIKGTPAGSPAYPAKGANDVIIGGLKIPATATTGDQITIDTVVRECASFPDDGKNSLLNSGFDHNQRGLSSIAYTDGQSLVYGLDRWAVVNSLGASGVVNIGQTGGSLPGSREAMQVYVGTAPGSPAPVPFSIFQVLEVFDAAKYVKKRACFGVKIKALGSINSVTLQFVVSSASPFSTNYTAIGSPVTVAINTASFTECQIPSLSMIGNLSTAENLGVIIIPSGVSSGNISDLSNGITLEQAQMNPGFILNPWKRAFEENTNSEKSALEAYFEKSFDWSTAPANNLTSSLGYNVWSAGSVAGPSPSIPFKTRKRITAPTVTVYNPKATTANSVYDFTSSTSVTAVGSAANESRFCLQITGSVAVGDLMYGQWTADAEIY